jgi:hypothetical protein
MRAPRRWKLADTMSPAVALEQAAKSLDPDLRYRALYNLGSGQPARVQS